MKTKIVCLMISLLWAGFGAFIQLAGYPEYNYLGFNYSTYNVLWWITFPFNILFFTIIFTSPLTFNVVVFLIILKLANVLIYWVLLNNKIYPNNKIEIKKILKRIFWGVQPEKVEQMHNKSTTRKLS